MQYKLKHRLSAALMAGAMCCTMIPAASADEIATPETADTAVPEVTDSAAPDISQITENLYNDLPHSLSWVISPFIITFSRPVAVPAVHFVRCGRPCSTVGCARPAWCCAC